MRESFDPLDANVSGDAPPRCDQDLPAVKFSCSVRTASSGFPRLRVLSWLQAKVPELRLQHILRVEAMAIELAQQHQLDAEKAAQAGLMHDLAKFFKPDRLLQMAQADGLALTPVDAADPHLLHADVGAIVARDEFGIHDVAVLNAIRNHTLGHPGMDGLSCIVFLADSLEPGRGDTPELAELRYLSRRNLLQAVWRTCDYSLKHLLSSRRLIHPRTIQTRNWFLQAAMQAGSSTHP